MNHLPTLRTLLGLPLIALLAGCGQSTSSTPEATSADPASEQAVEAATTCDPLVGEFRDLMADYEKGLQDMLAARKVDEARQQEWSVKAKDLSDRIQARGERELGMKCWQEFNTIGQSYAPRIADLGMKVAMIQMEEKGMDPAMIEQMQKAAGQ
ncbi:MAG: hypothetical protein IPJ76_07245 [Flavobacteriales bacterium]|nr:MAG: hypothetical protein IPJ76_07245 [Flavobacteriales bacterium]